MKIATWNIERLAHKKSLNEIESLCGQLGADILILTETDKRVKLPYKSCFKTGNLYELDSVFYGRHENRVSIYTNYECVRKYETFNKYTTACIELQTEMGKLIVYGTIMGVYGNRHASFKDDLMSQMEDIRYLSQLDVPICICGDYNLSFKDNYYYTKEGREILITTFDDRKIRLLTRNVDECIDHIAVSEILCDEKNVQITEWNQDKALSDHKGIMVELY